MTDPDLIEEIESTCPHGLPFDPDMSLDCNRCWQEEMVPDCNGGASPSHRHTHLCFGLDGYLGEL